MKHLAREAHPIITKRGIYSSLGKRGWRRRLLALYSESGESEGAKYLPKEQPSAALVEVEDRYTAFDNNTSTQQEGNTSYVEFKATTEGSKIAVQNLSYADRTNSRLIGLKFRTDGPATLELSNGVTRHTIHWRCRIRRVNGNI